MTRYLALFLLLSTSGIYADDIGPIKRYDGYNSKLNLYLGQGNAITREDIDKGDIIYKSLLLSTHTIVQTLTPDEVNPEDCALYISSSVINWQTDSEIFVVFGQFYSNEEECLHEFCIVRNKAGDYIVNGILTAEDLTKKDSPYESLFLATKDIFDAYTIEGDDPTELSLDMETTMVDWCKPDQMYTVHFAMETPQGIHPDEFWVSICGVPPFGGFEYSMMPPFADDECGEECDECCTEE